MATDKPMQLQLSDFECHFTWDLEEETIKNHSIIMNEINRQINENTDMKVEALLFKGYLFVSNFNGITFKKKGDAQECFVEVRRILSESHVEESIVNGYLAITMALETWIDRDDERKFEENIRNLSMLYSSFAANDKDKFFSSIHATKGFALSKVSMSRYDQTIDSYRQAIDACPDNNEWLFSLGLIIWRKAKLSCNKCYFHVGFEESERIFVEMLKNDPEHNHAMVLLVDIDKRRKNFRKADNLLQSAVNIERNQMYICGFAAKIYREMGMYKQAREVLDHAESLGDPSSFVLHQKAQMCDREGDLTSCISYLRKAIATDNCNIGAIFGLANALEKDVKVDEARALYDDMLRSFEQDMFRIIQINQQFGHLLIRIEEVEEGIHKYESVINDALEHFQEEEGNYNNPVKFDQIIKVAVEISIKKLREILNQRMLLNPNDTDPILKRAKLEKKLRCFRDADKYFHRIIEMKPQLDVDIELEVLCQLADIKIKTGELSYVDDLIQKMEQLNVDNCNIEVINKYKARLSIEKGNLAYKSRKDVEGSSYYIEAITLGNIDGAKYLLYELKKVQKRDTKFYKLCAQIDILSERNGGDFQHDLQEILEAEVSVEETTLQDLRKIQFTMEKQSFVKRPCLEYAKDIIHKARVILNRMMLAFRNRHYPDVYVPCNFFTVYNCKSQNDVEGSVKDTIEMQYRWRHFQEEFDELFNYIVSIQPGSNPLKNNWMIALLKMDDEENQSGNLGDVMETVVYPEDTATRREPMIKQSYKTVNVARTACDNIAHILRMFNT